jgi:hypothetical protein
MGVFLNYFDVEKYKDCNYIEYVAFRAEYCKKFNIQQHELDALAKIRIPLAYIDAQNKFDNILLYLTALKKFGWVTYESYKVRINAYRNNELDIFFSKKKSYKHKKEDGTTIQFRDISVYEAYQRLLIDNFEELPVLDLVDLLETYKLYFVGKASNYVFNYLMQTLVLPYIRKNILRNTDNIGGDITSMPFFVNFNSVVLNTSDDLSEYMHTKDFDNFVMQMNILFDCNRPQSERYWRGIWERKNDYSLLSPKSVREILNKNGF